MWLPSAPIADIRRANIGYLSTKSPVRKKLPATFVPGERGEDRGHAVTIGPGVEGQCAVAAGLHHRPREALLADLLAWEREQCLDRPLFFQHDTTVVAGAGPNASALRSRSWLLRAGLADPR